MIKFLNQIESHQIKLHTHWSGLKRPGGGYSSHKYLDALFGLFGGSKPVTWYAPDVSRRGGDGNEVIMMKFHLSLRE